MPYKRSDHLLIQVQIAASKMFFDPAFVEYVEGMIKDAPLVDYWDKVKHIT